MSITGRETALPQFLTFELRLEGRRVDRGISPTILAVDFDKAGWHQDAGTFLATCREFDVPAYLERSRSGNGVHVWVLFDRPVPAVDARRLGSALLTRATAARHEIGLDSYDRFFPNQDTVPKRGSGNLIALPLQSDLRLRRVSIHVTENEVCGIASIGALGHACRMTRIVARQPAWQLPDLPHQPGQRQ